MKTFMLRRKIEVLRGKLIETAQARGSFIDHEVVALSQELDRLLNDYNNRMKVAS